LENSAGFGKFCWVWKFLLGLKKSKGLLLCWVWKKVKDLYSAGFEKFCWVWRILLGLENSAGFEKIREL
jgi:hypothetical protein